MATEFVVLVDERDVELGVMEKLEAHQKGLLHRAFSVFLFNSQNQLLLQQRALDKYHSPGLWTNTCCSHPRPNETIKDAAGRRLFEEMGISCDLTIKTSFIYKASFDNGLTEHELDYVLVGSYDQDPVINASEANAYGWMSIEELKKAIKAHPGNYTEWFKIAIDNIF